jgi:hypothetical protein
LAHTHVPTLWTTQHVTLPRLEWIRQKDGVLESERTLPNGITFGAKVTPTPEGVLMRLWLKNGTPARLTGLRVQNCVMLKEASGFNQLTNTNKVFAKPYAAAQNLTGQRWIITAWEPCQRTWGNPKVPCLHSDPQFPDCEPGQTVWLSGWLSFYEGSEIYAELHRLDQAPWRLPQSSPAGAPPLGPAPATQSTKSPP